MKIYLGRLGGTDYSLNLEKGENNNTLIAGMAGTGKTTFMKTILYRMVENGFDENILIVDFTGEYGGLPGFKTLIPGINFFINPFKLPFPRNRDIIFYFIRYVFGKEVTPIQYYILSELILKYDNIRDIIRGLRDDLAKARDEGWRNAYASIFNRLLPLSEIEAIQKTTDIPDGYIHLNLAHMSEQEQLFFSIIALHYLYYLAKIGQYSAIIVIDEAEKIALPIRSETQLTRNIVTQIIDELRKYGLYIFLISHTICRLDTEIRNNCRNIFIFRLQDPNDVRLASEITFTNPVTIRSLQRFTCIHCDPYSTYVGLKLKIDIEPKIYRKFEPPKPIKIFEEIFEKARKTLLKSTNDKNEIRLLSNPIKLKEIYRFYKGRIQNIEVDEIYIIENADGKRLSNLSQKICKKLDKTIEEIMKNLNNL